MRILSSFHDYYDALASREPSEKLYLRESKILPGSAPHSILLAAGNEFLETLGGETQHIHYQARRGIIALHSFELLVAGVTYFGIALTSTHTGMPTQYFYNIDSLLKFLHANDLVDELLPSRGVFSESSRLSRIAKMSTLFEASGKVDKLLTFCIDNQIVLAAIDGNVARLNPSMQSFEFQQVLPAGEMYQKLDSWVTGVLPFNKPIPEMSDADKILSHGFDPKVSFRTRKE